MFSKIWSIGHLTRFSRCTIGSLAPYMNKIIDVKNKKAIKEIERFRLKKYQMTDIRFVNVHLKRLNKLLSYDLFSKNDLYINSSTLWELMQPVGDSGSHNYHGLSSQDIVDAISGIEDPYCILRVKRERMAAVPVSTMDPKRQLMVVIEIGAELIGHLHAGINKVVTIYPKTNIQKILERTNPKDILYRK